MHSRWWMYTNLNLNGHRFATSPGETGARNFDQSNELIDVRRNVGISKVLADTVLRLDQHCSNFRPPQ